MDNEHNLASSDEEYHKLLNNIFKNLPVGLKLYDKEGILVELNHTEMEMIGITDKNDLLGVSLFENPNIQEDIKEKLKAGERISCILEYDFDLAKKYYFTSLSGIKYFDFTASALYDEDGNLDKYLVITQDATKRVLDNREIRLSKMKTEMAMKASDVVIWEFDTKNRLFSCETKPGDGLNKKSQYTPEEILSAVSPKNQQLAKEAMQKMLNGEDISSICEVEMRFPDQTDWQYCTVSSMPFEKKANGDVIEYVGFVKNNTRFRKKEMLLGKVLNNMPLSVQIKDVEDNYRYVFCNEESNRLFGINKNKTADDTMIPELVEKIKKTDRSVFNTGKTFIEQERIILKDGRSYETIVQKSIIEDDGKRLLLVIRWDMSIQKELERKTKIFSISLSALNAYAWFYDVEKDFLSCGDGSDKFGSKIGTWYNLDTFIQSVHPDDQKLVRKTLMGMSKRKSGEFAIEYRIDMEGDRSYTWWECRGIVETVKESGGSHRNMYGMDINIEARKNTELQLLKNKGDMAKLIRQNELVLNNVNSGLAYIANNYIVQWENISISSASITYEAYKKGEPCYQSAHARTSPCEDCLMQRAIKSGQMEHTKFTLQNDRIVEVFATPVLNESENEKVDGIVIRIDDITERQKMITELEHAKQKAEESDKLKSAFLANMSHEIRTPLNAIVGFSDLLMTAITTEEKEEYIRIINTNNELLLKLINDILDLSKIESGSIDLKYEEFDLADYFKEIFAIMQQRIASPHVQLVATNPYLSCIVEFDKNRLAQIITNFVTNSIKFTPQGIIEMGYEIINEGIHLYVRDTGTGIPEDKKDKVFQRFEKLNEFAQGTGLGLSICKAISEACGGSIGFESELGEGATFWSILPCEIKAGLSKDQSEQFEISSVFNREHAKYTDTVKKETILVVEDNFYNYHLVAILLKQYYNILHCNNGLEAVDLMRNQPVDLILMDMKMPVMDGLTATKEIRTFNTHTPIIALTAHAFESDRIAALEAGCNDYLVKPINKKVLYSTIEAFCRTSKTNP